MKRWLETRSQGPSQSGGGSWRGNSLVRATRVVALARRRAGVRERLWGGRGHERKFSWSRMMELLFWNSGGTLRGDGRGEEGEKENRFL